MKVDFIFDFASPNAYFCHKLIPIIEDRTDVSFNYIPCLLGGIFKLSGNQPPFMAFADIPNKNAYQMIEIERFVKQHELTKYQFNSNFPINTVQIQRGSIAAQELNVFDQYLDVVITAMWEDNKNLNDLDILKATLNENNMDVEAIFNIVNSQECKDRLIANTSAAVERGAFGVPTFFLDNQIFFGKDHLYQLEEYINSNQK